MVDAVKACDGVGTCELLLEIARIPEVSLFAKAGFGSLPGAVLKLAESTRGELKATEVERIKAELDKAMVANYQLRRDMSAIQRGRKIIEGELRAEIERLTP